MGETLLATGGMVVRRVENDQLAFYWPQIEEELDTVPHIWDTWWTKEALYEGVLNGRFQLWGAGTAKAIQVVVFTQIAMYPTGAILQCLLAFGNQVENNLPALAATLEYAAQRAGCHSFEVVGRRGWARLLKKYNPDHCNVVLTFRVPQERIH